MRDKTRFELARRAQPAMVIAAMLAAAVVIGGCASSQPAPLPYRVESHKNDVSSGLVFANADLSDGDSGMPGWEFGRNDARMGAPPSPDFGNPGFVRVYTRDYLYTSNGLPREFSTSTTTTVQQGVNR